MRKTNKLIHFPKDMQTLDDTVEKSQSQSESLRQSFFKMGDSIYRSIYDKPMKSIMWVCCWRVEKAPSVGASDCRK